MIVPDNNRVNLVIELVILLQHHIKTTFANTFHSGSLSHLNYPFVTPLRTFFAKSAPRNTPCSLSVKQAISVNMAGWGGVGWEGFASA